MSVQYSQDFIDGYRECLDNVTNSLHASKKRHNNGVATKDLIKIQDELTLSLYQQAFNIDALQRDLDTSNPHLYVVANNKED